MTAQVVRAGRIVATVNRAISRGTTTGQPVLRTIRATASPVGWRRRSPSAAQASRGTRLSDPVCAQAKGWMPLIPVRTQ
ncbi:hypothetical protein ACRJ4W_51215 [Streptomyces sp. GLT-R25]